MPVRPSSRSEGLSWLKSVFQSLSEKIEPAIFHDGNEFEIFESLYGNSDATAAVSLLVTVILHLAQNCIGLDDVASSIFPWYEPRARRGHLSALAHLISHHVLLERKDDHSETLSSQSMPPFDLKAEGGIYTIPPASGNAYDVPVSFLPFSVASRMDGPPKYGVLPDLQLPPPQHRVVKIFLSHRWAEPETPNLDNDWREFLDLINRLVDRSIQCFMTLWKADFPMKYLLTDTLPAGCACDEQIDLPGVAMWVDTEDYSPEDSVPVSFIQSNLALNVLKVVADEFMNRTQKSPQETCKAECKTNVAKRIWLWYDYCSLPQKPNRTEAERRWFKRSLSQLPMIQISMHTVILNSSPTYFGRAWCFAEWANAGNESSIWDRDSDLGSLLLGSKGGNDKDDDTYDNVHGHLSLTTTLAWKMLVDPRSEPSDILTALDLNFTDDEHEKNTITICWILWVAACRLTLLLDNLESGLCIGYDTPSKTIQWLKIIHGAMSNDPVHNFEAWDAARNQQSPMFDSHLDVVIPVPFDSNYPPTSLLRTAIGEAIKIIEKRVLDEQRGETCLLTVFLQRAKAI